MLEHIDYPVEEGSSLPTIKKRHNTIMNLSVLCCCILALVSLQGCTKNTGRAGTDQDMAQNQGSMAGVTPISGQVLMLTENNTPLEVTVGSPYTSAIGESCFEAKAHLQGQSTWQPRVLCNRNNTWELMPSILMTTPNYTLTTVQ